MTNIQIKSQTNKNSRKNSDRPEERPAEQSAVAPAIVPITRPMLGWLPEREYLFSLVSRNHAYWGYRAAADTVGVFFGTRKERALGPACSDVEYLVARTEGCLGSPIEIFQNHTLFRFYRLFMKPSEVKNLLAPSSTTAESQLKYPMALWNGLFTARHPLKACIECMEADLADLGMPYWRLSHQYPGVWICLAHKRILQRTSVKTSSQLRFNLHCPDAYSRQNGHQFLFQHVHSFLRQSGRAFLSIPATPA